MTQTITIPRDVCDRGGDAVLSYYRFQCALPAIQKLAAVLMLAAQASSSTMAEVVERMRTYGYALRYKDGA